MAYITKDDIISRMGAELLAQCTNDVDGSTPDDSVVEALIAEAESTVDSYLRGRYVLPLVDVPTEVKRIALDLCQFYIIRRRPNQVSDVYQNFYDAAIATLGRIQRGVQLLETGTTGRSTKSRSRTNKSASSRIFNDTTLGRLP